MAELTVKRVDLICIHCKTVKTFRALNVDAALQEIDESGWSDLPSGGKGWMDAVCPGCLEKGLDGQSHTKPKEGG